MINIDTRLLYKLDENDFWLLLHLIKFLGKNGSSWPGNKRICKDTGWNIDKVQRVKKSLIDKGFLSFELVLGSSNIYRFHTKLVGVFNGVDGAELVDSVKSGIPENPVGGVTGKHGREYTGKSGSKVLSNEVLSNEVLSTVDLPFGLPFKKAWNEWVGYRKEIKKRMTPFTVRLQLSKLAVLTEPEAIAIIEKSISNGWIGLIFDKGPTFEKKQSAETDAKGNPLPKHLIGFVQ